MARHSAPKTRTTRRSPATGRPPRKQRKKDDAELQDWKDTINISTDEDRKFVHDFIQAVIDLAQESIGTQSKFSAQELRALGFRSRCFVHRSTK
jgi:maltoporin